MEPVTATRANSVGGRSDAALLKKAREGDSQALAEIYESTYPEVYRTIRSMIKGEDDAMDILQDSYLKAFSRLDSLDQADSLRPWLRQIAANAARDFLRRKKPSLFSELQTDDELPLDFEDEREQALPELALDRKETTRLVREMLDGLSEEQRLVVGMFYYQEIPVKQIAEQLNVSQNTVKSQLRYGRQKIEKRVRALEQQGVKLYGAAPIPFFCAALRQALGGEAPSTLGKTTAKIAAEGSSALAKSATGGMKVRTVTARGAMLRRLAAGAAAVVAVGGIAVGAGILMNRNRDMGDVRPEQNESAAQTQDGWENAYLSALAGEDHAADEDYYGMSGMWMSDATEGKDTDYFYLTWPEQSEAPILIDRGNLQKGEDALEEDILYLLTYQNGSATETVLEYKNIWYAGEENTISSALLYHPLSNRIVVYSEGTDMAEYRASEERFYATCIGFRRPSSGMLQTLTDDEQRQIRFECYSVYQPGTKMESCYLCVTDLQSGERSYWMESSGLAYEEKELSAEDYDAAVQGLLEATSLRLLDDTGAEQLAQIPAAELEGPMDILTLSTRLGGFRNEHVAAQLAVIGLRPVSERYTELISNQALAETLLEEQFPAALYGGHSEGTWDYALCRTDGDTWLLMRYQQSPAEGGDWLLLKASYGWMSTSSGPTSGIHITDPAQVDAILQDWDDVAIRRGYETAAGTVYLTDRLYGENYPIRFVSAEEALALLAGDEAEAVTVDYSAPQTWEPSAEAERGTLAALYVQHPEALISQDALDALRPGLQAGELDWSWALVSDRLDGDPAKLLLLSRGSLQTDKGETWLLCEVELSDDGSMWAVNRDVILAGHPWDLDIGTSGDYTNIQALAGLDGSLPVVTYIGRDEEPMDGSYFVDAEWQYGDSWIDRGGFVSDRLNGHSVVFRPTAEMQEKLLQWDTTLDLVD